MPGAINKLACLNLKPVAGFLNGLWEKTSGRPRVKKPEVLEHYWSGR